MWPHGLSYGNEIWYTLFLKKLYFAISILCKTIGEKRKKGGHASGKFTGKPVRGMEAGLSGLEKA